MKLLNACIHSLSGSTSVITSIEVQVDYPGEHNRLISYINGDNLKVKDSLSKAQQSKKAAQANELHIVHKKIDEAVLKGGYSTTVNPQWPQTIEALKAEGYAVHVDTYSNYYYVSWGAV